MIDLLDIVYFRKEIQSDGEDWISLKYIGAGLHLAIRKHSEFPSEVFLIKDDNFKGDV